MDYYYHCLLVILILGIFIGYKMGYQKANKDLKPGPPQKEVDQIAEVMIFLQEIRPEIEQVEIGDNKGIQGYDELLMQQILSLDGVMNRHLRKMRKILVVEIQELQRSLDEKID